MITTAERHLTRSHVLPQLQLQQHSCAQRTTCGRHSGTATSRLPSPRTNRHTTNKEQEHRTKGNRLLPQEKRRNKAARKSKHWNRLD
jgi:hypothetical protein